MVFPQVGNRGLSVVDYEATHGPGLITLALCHQGVWHKLIFNSCIYLVY